MFLGFCKRVFLFEALFWVLKGLLHLIWWICDLFIFVSPLTFTLQTLKLSCGESWDLYMFNGLCMLMRIHYAMFYMFHKLCMFMQVHLTMLCKFYGLCMLMRVHLTMLCKFYGLCMFMRVHYDMICKFNMYACLLWYVKFIMYVMPSYLLYPYALWRIYKRDNDVGRVWVNLKIHETKRLGIYLLS